MNHSAAGTQQEFQTGEAKRISILINSIYYFIECVYILILHDHCRLIVLHHGRVLTDKRYKTVRGARIAFAKLYKHKGWKEGIKAQRSHLYDPEAKWLEERSGDVRLPNHC